jgi:hypothetical protein
MYQHEIDGAILDGDSYSIRKVQLSKLTNYEWHLYKEWDNVKIMFISLGGDITNVNILGERLLSKHIYGPLIFIMINDTQITEIKISDIPEIIDLSINVNNDLLKLKNLSETKIENESDVESELNYTLDNEQNGYNGYDSW